MTQSQNVYRNHRSRFVLCLIGLTAILATTMVLALDWSVNQSRGLRPGHMAKDPPPSFFGDLGTILVNGTLSIPDGTGQRIGVIEASQGVPHLMPGGVAHPFLPVAQINLIPAALPAETRADTPNSHATEVAGVIVSSHANHRGLARAARIEAAGHTGESGSIRNSQVAITNGSTIMNFSWGGGQPGNGGSLRTLWADWAARTKPGLPIQDIAFAMAGEEGNDNDPVKRDSFNGTTVGALGQGKEPWPDFRQEAAFNRSNRNITADVSPITGLGRHKTDIMAAGYHITAPTHGGGLAAAPGVNGTSFATPHVSATFALLRQYRGFPPTPSGTYSTDHRVLKAGVLNATHKSVSTRGGRVWRPRGDTMQTKGAAPAIPIVIGQDETLGMGGLDVLQAHKQYRVGEQDPGFTTAEAWDLQTIAASATNSYELQSPSHFCNPPGSGPGDIHPRFTITVTLAYDRVVNLNDPNGNNHWDTEDRNGNGRLDGGEDTGLGGVPGSAGNGTLDQETFADNALPDLDLELVHLVGAPPQPVVARSSSDIDSVEHIHYRVPLGAAPSRYRLDVINRSATVNTEYAVAWNVKQVDRFDTGIWGLQIEFVSGPTVAGNLMGPATAEVQEVGEVDGDMFDDLLTEMIELNLAGDFNGNAVRLVESPLFQSLGAVEEQINLFPGTLEFSSPFPPPAPADSFFDIYVEVTATMPMPIGKVTLFNKDPIRVSAEITCLPPSLGTQYVITPGSLVWWNTYQGQFVAADVPIPLYNIKDPHGAVVANLTSHPHHEVEAPCSLCACCLPSGSCVDMAGNDCTAIDGAVSYGAGNFCGADDNGNGVDDLCEPLVTGACCRSDDSCIEGPSEQCATFTDAVYQGDYTTCLPNLCVGCGDGTCDPSEDVCNCPEDCGPALPGEENCNDGFDDDCDIDVDCDDAECAEDGACAVPPPPIAGAGTTRTLSMTVPPPTTATGTSPQAAIKITMTDLQNPVPPNNNPVGPCCPPGNFITFDTTANSVCVGGTDQGYRCPPSACPGSTCPAAVGCTAVGEGNGCARWVGRPQRYLESNDNPSLGSYKSARLQCAPFYHDWGSEGEVHVVGAEIVPSSSYTVQTYAAGCKGNEATCILVSALVPMTTRRAGDIATPFEDGNPPVTEPAAVDVANAVNKFRNLPGAPVKVIAQVQPNSPDPNSDVNAIDIVTVVDNVRGFGYSYSGPCVCPSTVPCNTTACGGSGQCIGLYGAGATCVKTCSSGPRQGFPCNTNLNCGSCSATSTNPGIPCDANGDCPGGSCDLGTCPTGATPGFCRDRCGRCN